MCEPASLACVANSKSFDLAYFDLQLSLIPGKLGATAQEKRHGVIRTRDYAERMAEYTLLRHGRVIMCLKGSVLHDALREDGQGKSSPDDSWRSFEDLWKAKSLAGLINRSTTTSARLWILDPKLGYPRMGHARRAFAS